MKNLILVIDLSVFGISAVSAFGKVSKLRVAGLSSPQYLAVISSRVAILTDE